VRRALVLSIVAALLAGCGASGSGPQSRAKPTNEANLMRQEHRPAPIKIDKQQDPNPYSVRQTG
jgi:outer membrane biogenesis lipoprotein LolB